MAIQEGDKVPSVNLQYMGADGVETISSDDLFAGKKDGLAYALHYADLGDIQQNIFSLIIKITFCYGFSSKFQECLLGVKRMYRKKIYQIALFVTKIEFFLNFFGHKFYTNSFPLSANLV